MEPAELIALRALGAGDSWRLNALPLGVGIDELRVLDENGWIEVRPWAHQNVNGKLVVQPLPWPLGWCSPVAKPDLMGGWDRIFSDAKTTTDTAAELRLSERGRAALARESLRQKRQDLPDYPSDSPAATNGAARDLAGNLRDILGWIDWLRRAELDDPGSARPAWWDGYVDDAEWPLRGNDRRPPNPVDRLSYARRRTETALRICHEKWDNLTSPIPIDNSHRPLFNGCREALRNLLGILSPAQMGPKLRYGVVPHERHLDATGPKADAAIVADWRETIARWRLREKAVRDLLAYLTGPTTPPAPSSPAPSPDQGQFVLQLHGERWAVRFATEHGSFSPIDGFDYLSQLIARPHQRIPSAALLLNRRRNTAGPRLSRSVAESSEADESANSRTGAVKDNPRLDPAAKSDLEKAISEVQGNVRSIRAELDEARSEGREPEAERLERDELNPEIEKLNRLTQRLRADQGFRGKVRPLGSSETALARQTIVKAIKLAIAKMRAKGMPDCARHFENSIPDALEGDFVYRPDSQHEWQTE